VVVTVVLELNCQVEASRSIIDSDYMWTHIYIDKLTGSIDDSAVCVIYSSPTQNFKVVSGISLRVPASYKLHYQNSVFRTIR
jgi:hypothetical protein